VATAILSVPQFRDVVDKFDSLESILSQLGATYGTILALVLTLSIIPIQRAAEVWSTSIVRLYRRDPVTYTTFVSLGIFCVASFLLAVKGLFPIPVSMVLALSLSVLGISLDILRWYHSHVCRLLDPVYAISVALKEAKQSVDHLNAQVSRIARLQYHLLSTEQQQQVNVEAIESTIYPRLPDYPVAINYWLNDFAEIGIKAVTRGEALLAKTAVSAISNLTCHYLSSRKLNLTLEPAPEAIFLVMTSDVSVVTDRAYEALQEISRIAVTQGDEATAIRVSDAYKIIAIHTSSLGASAFLEGTAPLTFSPIYYAFACIKYAQSKGLDEIAFQSTGILSKISETASKDIAPTNIHEPVIDGIVDIAMYLYGKRSYVLAEKVNGHVFSILAHLLQRQDYFFDRVLRYVLMKMEILAPLAIINESMAGRLSTVHPLGKAYGVVSSYSLAYLFKQAAVTLPKVDTEREWINPYHDLADIAGIIAEHLRNIAENNEFSDSVLLREIDQLIKHLSKVIAGILEQPLRQNYADETVLIDKLFSILAFYWIAFRNKKAVSALRADGCSESLMFIGLLFFERGHPEILRTCISHIRSIFESYCEIAKPTDTYTIGDLLAHLWSIRMVLVKKANGILIQQVDQALITKPRELTEEQWQASQEAIMLRRQQLERRLAERFDYSISPDSGEFMLRKLLQ
jgi:hypothetical protein